MNNNSQSWYCSWWAIIIAFIVFWPVGIALLILRNTKNKQAVFLGSTSKKIYIIAGLIIIFCGVMYFPTSGFIGFFMIVGGISLVVYAEKLKKRSERNRKYIDLIINREEKSLDIIANDCNIQYNTVVKELKQLVKIGVLKNADIDENSRTIRIQRVPVQQENRFESFPNAMGMETQVAGVVQNEKVECTCPGCGARIILVKGSAEDCEYCGAPIYAK